MEVGLELPFPAPMLLQASNCRHAPGFDRGFKDTTGPRKWTGRENRTAVLPMGAGWSWAWSEDQAVPG